MADWRTDPHAQAMMSLLVAAGVAMHRQRVAASAKASRGVSARVSTEGVGTRVVPPSKTVSPERAGAAASHPALINHEMA